MQTETLSHRARTGRETALAHLRSAPNRAARPVLGLETLASRASTGLVLTFVPRFREQVSGGSATAFA